jgi:hypothetical protein
VQPAELGVLLQRVEAALNAVEALLAAADPVAAARRVVFARELLLIGPWRTRDALKKAHRRGVLREGEHWDWVGGVRAYYLDRLFPGLAERAIGRGDEGEGHDDAEATARRLRRVLAACPSGQAAA